MMIRITNIDDSDADDGEVGLMLILNGVQYNGGDDTDDAKDDEDYDKGADEDTDDSGGADDDE